MIKVLTDTVPGIEPKFSTVYKRHYVQNIDRYRSNSKRKLQRKQFRNRLLNLKVSELIYVDMGAGNFQGAIVLKVYPLHFDVYGQVSQNFFSINRNGTWMTSAEYETKFPNEVAA